MTAEEFLKKEGYFNSPHFPFDHVAGLMHRYALSQKAEVVTEKKVPFYCWHADVTIEDACAEQCEECKNSKLA